MKAGWLFSCLMAVGIGLCIVAAVQHRHLKPLPHHYTPLEVELWVCRMRAEYIEWRLQDWTVTP